MSFTSFWRSKVEKLAARMKAIEGIVDDGNIEAVTLTTSGNVSVGGTLAVTGTAGFSGNASVAGLLTLTGGQIAFPATQVPSGGANVLDDYEEGTWTPTLTTNGVNFTSVTYDAVTAGKYTKIGNVVYISGRLRTDAVNVGSATGSVAIGGLPFTAAAGNPESSIAVSDCASWAGEEPLGGIVGASSTSIFWHYRNAVDAGTSLLVVADVGTGADANRINFSGFYFV